ncbi:MAG: PLDc_N domain-containing protein [Actinobacteria bacterium]|nr:PLDc_N domain-containing protein [Actinomycetota bacterium]
MATKGLPLLIEVGLLVYALVDCIQTPVPRNLPKWGWLVVIIVLPLFGSIAWLVLGRPDRRAGQVPWPATGTAGYPESERPQPGRAGRSRAPDGVPDFLAGLAARREDETRLAAGEENLRRREDELKKDGSPEASGTTPPDDAAPGAPGQT